VKREKMVFSEKVTIDGLQLAKIGYLKLSAFIGLDPSANFYPIKRRHFKDIEEKLRKLFKSRKSQGNFKEGKNFMETVIINGLRTASFVHKKLTQTEPTYPGLRKGNFVMNFGDLKQILSLTKLIWNDVAKITLNVLASCDLTSQNGGFILINLSH
ncbi:MAG: hypothetical protein NZT61_04610, partial [Deltaproteobacteria bacterium]|nr:hypothetical protein [Deltaproteobacteria bacterium]